MQIAFQSIGIIHSPYKTVQDMPIQPGGAKGVRGSIQLDEAWQPALQDLCGFSHIILLYHFHKVTRHELLVMPFLDTQTHGLFATRAPRRPNPIGLSIVKLISVEGGVLYIDNVDVLDGTPLLDIKPYVPAFDIPREEIRTGWLAGKAGRITDTHSDDRFV